MIDRLPKAVVFDMDGTLIDNYPVHLETWQLICSNYGAPRTIEEIIRDLHGTNFEICQKFFGPSITLEQSDIIGNEKEALYREVYRPRIAPVDGLMELMDQLAQFKIPMALGTMGNRDNAEFVIDALGLDRYLSAVFTAEDVERGKPHPDIFNKCFEIIDPKGTLHRTEKWVFEDTSSGIEAAINAGAVAIGVRTSKTHEELTKHGANSTVANYHEVLKMFY